MKKHQLILLTTALFTALFYGEDLGLNFGILGICYALLTLYQTPEKNRTRKFLIIFVLGVLSNVAFAWYGDFVSFLAVFSSMFLLAFLSKNKDLKSILVIPLFVVNFVTFVYRFFKFEDWLPKTQTSRAVQKLISLFLIPGILLLLFLGIYSVASTNFSGIFTDYEFDFNAWEFFVLSALGFFIAFNYWNFKVENFLFSWNHQLKNDFLNEEKSLKPSFSFLDFNAERRSGIVSLLALNLLLIVFIITFNYEVFVEIPRSADQLSGETHQRVNAVILSIIMAVLVILFYFKGSFNFDQEAKPLKILAKIWVVLNAILVISALIKISEYVVNFGLTYKRMGVYAFLILALIGLFFTFIKIQKPKTNAFIFNHMIWYFYGTILVSSFINWGNFATVYNLKNGKGDFNFYNTLHYNDEILNRHFPNEMKASVKKIVAKQEQNKPFLSQFIYYQTLK